MEELLKMQTKTKKKGAGERTTQDRLAKRRECLARVILCLSGGQHRHEVAVLHSKTRDVTREKV